MEDIVIDIIDDFDAFQAVRNRWETVYTADPEGQFFLSWIWLSGVLKWYSKSHGSWFILAARSNRHASEYVAFFPLAISIAKHPDSGLYSILSMLGVAESEHIGFISLPEAEEAVSSAFARFLQQEVWSVFKVENIQAPDGRMSRFLSLLCREEFELKEYYHLSDLDQIDNSIVPSISLPNDWEQYLQTVVSSNTRQKIRRFLRKIETSNEFHLTQVNAENLELHIEILLGFWISNWKSRKSEDYCRRMAGKIGFVLRHCFEHQCLYLPVLWQGDKPLGAIANLMDFSHKTILFFISSREDTVKNLSPGTILHAYGIQYAIENGFKVYDFLMGNEAYKFSFGAKERRIKTVAIQCKDLPSQNQILNLRTIPEALHISVNHHQANRLNEAEQGYRQILKVQPQHPEALYRLGVVMQRKGAYPVAEELLRSLLQVQPQDGKAWFSLGNLYQVQGQLLEAEKAYRQALTLQPEPSKLSPVIYHNLGYTLKQQGNWEEAIACYQRACDLQPDFIEAEVSLANALYDQKKLCSQKQAHYAAVNYELGNKRHQAGDLTVATEYYRQSIAMNPNLAKSHYHLGVILQEQGNWEEAIACYQRACDLQPDFIEAEVSLANVLHDQRKLSLEKQAHYAAVNYELGSKCKQASDLEGAIKYYRQSLSMNPNLAEVQYHLGLALQKQRKWEAAIACYQRVQALRPDYILAELGVANILFAQNQLSAEDREHYAAINYKLGNTHYQTGDLKSAIKHYWQAITLRPDWVEVRDRLRLALQEQHDIKIKVSVAESGRAGRAATGHVHYP